MTSFGTMPRAAAATSSGPPRWWTVRLTALLLTIGSAPAAGAFHAPPLQGARPQFSASSAGRAQAGAPPGRVSGSERQGTLRPSLPKETRTGRATYIARRFEGRKTASGEIYNGNDLVAAHPVYPMGTRVRVTNLENARAVEVTIIDRSARGKGRNHPIIDLSRAAAERLDFIRRGKTNVTVEVIE
jgi:rare lipoprotein A (peptidoglycan hydrolase)